MFTPCICRNDDVIIITAAAASRSAFLASCDRLARLVLDLSDDAYESLTKELSDPAMFGSDLIRELLRDASGRHAVLSMTLIDPPSYSLV